MAIEARIVDAIPTSEYDGKVYDQRVVVELPGGSKLGLFDPDMKVMEDMVSEVHQIEIGLLIPEGGISVVSGEDIGISPESSSPSSWNNHAYTAKVEERTGNGETVEMLLDLGIGCLTLNVRSSLVENVNVGDIIQIEAQRSDLKRVKNRHGAG